MPIYRGEGGSGTGSSGKPGGGTGGGGSTGPITTKDVLLTNSQSPTLVTQEDANQYFVDSIDDLNNSSGGGGGGNSGPVEWADIQNKPKEILDLTAENINNESLVSGGSF